MNFAKFFRTPFLQATVSQKLIYDSGRPQLSDKKIVLKMFGKYPGAYLHRIATFKLKVP